MRVGLRSRLSVTAIFIHIASEMRSTSLQDNYAEQLTCPLCLTVPLLLFT